MSKKFLVLALVFFVLPIAVSAASYKNYLPQKSWVKYGVNPWSIDTDNDGYPDDYEVKFGYCPTSPDSIKLDDSACEKGKINLSAGTYSAPAAVTSARPATLKKFSSCENINNWVATLNDHLAVQKAEMDHYITTINTTTLNTTTQQLIIDKIITSAAFVSGLTIADAPSEEKVVTSTDKKRVYELGEDNKQLIIHAVGNDKILGKINFGAYYFTPQVISYRNKVVFVGTASEPEQTNQLDIGDNTASGEITAPKLYVKIQVWQVSNPARPILERELRLSETYASHSAVVGDYLYLALYSSLPASSIDTGDSQSDFVAIPKIASVTKGKVGAYQSVAKCSDVLYPELNNTGVSYPHFYIHLVAIPLESANGAIGHKVIYGLGQQLAYANGSVYITRNTAGNNMYVGDLGNEQTEIYKINLVKNSFVPVETQILPGLLVGPIEYSGDYWRVFTGRNLLAFDGPKLSYDLNILDKDLSKRGWYQSIVWDKQIFGVKNTPTEMRLFVTNNGSKYKLVDFSAPLHPVVIGEFLSPVNQ